MFFLSLLGCLGSESSVGTPRVGEVIQTPAEGDTGAPLIDFGAPDMGAGGSVTHLPLDATLELSQAIGTVATVRWATDQPSAGWVEIWEPGRARRVFEDPATSTQHEVVLVGLAEGSQFTWRAVAELEDGTLRTSDTEPLVTDAAPEWLPSLQVDLIQDSSPGGFVLATVTGDADSVFMLDDEGRYVWWWRGEGASRSAAQARLSRDGQSVYVLELDDQFREDLGQLRRVDLLGNVVTTVRADMAHHDFVELADGRLAYLAVDVRSYGGKDVAGDALHVVDLTTGAREALWSTWDQLVPPTEFEPTGFYGFAEDWTHANGLFHDEVTGDWLVSLHSLDAVVRISPEGDLRWQMGGADSDFTLAEGVPFSKQHCPSLTATGLLVFDNAAQGDGHFYSRAVEYQLDEDRMTYAQRWDTPDGGVFVRSRGSADRLPAGQTLIGFGSEGRIAMIDTGGAPIWQVDATDGSPLGFTHWIPTLGER